MPYYLYHIQSDKSLKLNNEFDKYRPAKIEAKKQRIELPKDADYTVKIMFGKSQIEAEMLLKEIREVRPLGDD